MMKSARLLGQDYGMTGREMNVLLKQEGYLDGVPGDYNVTEKGSMFAAEKDYHRGTGGYAQYNRYWSERTWDDNIVDELDITPEKIRNVRDSISYARNNPNIEVYDGTDAFDSLPDDAGKAAGSLATIITVGIISGAAIAAVYFAPRIKLWWDERRKKTMPALPEKIEALGQ